MFGVFPLLGARPWDELLPAAISLLLKISVCERGLSKEELDSDADESSFCKGSDGESPPHAVKAQIKARWPRKMPFFIGSPLCFFINVKKGREYFIRDIKIRMKNKKT